MRYTLYFVGCVILLTAGCGEKPKQTSDVHITQEPTPSVDKDTEYQNRLNSFFYAALVPKLQTCWSRLQGKGQVTFKYTYVRSGDNWTWKQQEIEQSDLPKDQATLSSQCMQDAASGTAFPMLASEAARKSNQFDIHWTWPVPFPNAATMAMMISTGGGGRGECSQTCVDCSCSTTGPSKCTCTKSCSGYTGPCTVDSDGTGCRMFLPVCSTGRIGFGGGLVIAREGSEQR